MPDPQTLPPPGRSGPLREIVRLFLRLGFTAFGGPAAHIALLHDETVVRRRWLDDQAFLDLMGATNLIPGPNSTELVIHLGYLRGGRRGMALAGTCFVLPATLIVLVLAAAYARFGSLPAAQWLLYGVKPVVIAIIARALWKLLRKAVQGPATGCAALLSLTAYFAGYNPIALLLGAGLLVMLGTNLRRLRGTLPALAFLPLGAVSLPAAAAVPFGLPLLFFTFLKIGSVMYGSGYVLLAFLRADFVVRLGWLTDQQLLDAVAVGQITPGPLFTAATFIGYLMGGTTAALVATLGIFLPSFILVAVSNPFIPRLRRSPWLGALLDGVNAASLALMAAVTWQLGLSSLIDPLTGLLAVAALLLLVLRDVGTTWLILGGALAGGLRWLLA